ncbi:hypothetical protein WJX82_011244 [Trebouxia sp. C0006]
MAKPYVLLLSATLCALLFSSTHARTLAQSDTLVLDPARDRDSDGDSQSAAGPGYRQPHVTIPVVPAVPGNVSSSGEFVKQTVWESFPAYYRLATSHEAKSNETALHEVMPNWEIAYLADGSVGGALYGDSTTPFEANKTTLGDKLGIHDWSIPEVQVSGLDAVVNYTSPAEVCLQPALDAANLGSLNVLEAVIESQVQSIQQLVALWNLDVMSEGMSGVTTLFTQVVPAVPGNFSSSGEFVKVKVWEAFPDSYRLATSQEAKSNETALYEALPGWEIAYSADGLVGGALYGTITNSSQPSKTNLADKLGIQDLETPEDASNTTFAAIVLPANKPVGAGAFQRALLESMHTRAVALVVPPSLNLTPIYRWVLVLQLTVDFIMRLGVI